MEDRLDHTLLLRSRKLETVNTARKHGAGIRVFHGNDAIYVYTNDTSREGLMECAAQAAAAVRAGAGCTPIAMRPTHAERPEQSLMLPGTVKAALKAEKLREADAAARACSA